MSISGNIIKIYNIDEDIFHTSGSTTPLNLEVVSADDLPLSGCVEVNSVLIRTFPDNQLLNDCGCPTDECGEASLKITIKNITPPPSKCDFDGFTLDNSGLVLFTINGSETYYMASECCENLGFTSELDSNNVHVCRWGVAPNICSSYSQIAVNNGYVFFSDTDGPNTYEVPTTECCPIDTIPQLQLDGYYKCLVRVVVDPIDCSQYSYSSLDFDGYVVFSTASGFTTTVPSDECCPTTPYQTSGELQTDGSYKCLLACLDYIDYSFDPTGYVLFTGVNGDIFAEVPYAACCPRLTTPELVFNDDINAPQTLLCKNSSPHGGGGSEICRYLSVLRATPNPSGGLTSINVSGLYCDETSFSYDFTFDTGPINVNSCIIPNSITITPNAPQRVNYIWDDSQTCGAIPNFTMSGLRSFFGTTNNNTPFCTTTSYPLDTDVVLRTMQSLILNIGDYVFINSSTPFNGGNKWYRLAFSVVDPASNFYFAKIAVNGVILDIINCS